MSTLLKEANGRQAYEKLTAIRQENEMQNLTSAAEERYTAIERKQGFPNPDKEPITGATAVATQVLGNVATRFMGNREVDTSERDKALNAIASIRQKNRDTQNARENEHREYVAAQATDSGVYKNK